VKDAETYKTASFVTRNAPKLKDLHLEGAGQAEQAPLILTSGVGAFGVPYTGDGGVGIDLPRLTLDWLGLKAQSAYLTKYVDFCRLSSLQIICCKNTEELIEALTLEFKRACNLRELKIRISRHPNAPERTIQAVEDLLKSFTGLESL
jgi:hypothetical protein